MARVQSRNTGPELVLRRALHARGLRYKLHDSALPGRPDLVFPRFGAVCFVHGCFWHRYDGCPRATTPATNRAYWERKFEGNVRRDRAHRVALLEVGWRAGVIWECVADQGPVGGVGSHRRTMAQEPAPGVRRHEVGRVAKRLLERKPDLFGARADFSLTDSLSDGDLSSFRAELQRAGSIQRELRSAALARDLLELARLTVRPCLGIRRRRREHEALDGAYFFARRLTGLARCSGCWNSRVPSPNR